MASVRVFPTSKIPNGQWFSPCTASPGGWLRRPPVAGFAWSCLCFIRFGLCWRTRRSALGEGNTVTAWSEAKESPRRRGLSGLGFRDTCSGVLLREREIVDLYRVAYLVYPRYTYSPTLSSYLLPTSLAAAVP